jgi:hypothetical protein
MLAMGWNLERISLGSLIIALGLLVDDAIIAIEMMVVKMEEGVDRIRAAAYAWSHTAAPMLSGTLVTVAGFLPVGFARSSAGEYAGNIFWIVGFALIASWVVAVAFTPYLGVAPSLSIRLAAPKCAWKSRSCGGATALPRSPCAATSMKRFSPPTYPSRCKRRWLRSSRSCRPAIRLRRRVRLKSPLRPMRHSHLFFL